RRGSAGLQREPGQLLQHPAVLVQQPSVGDRQGLVEAEDGVVPEGSERLPTRCAEEGLRAVFDQEHPVLAAQLALLFEWLWPAQGVNDEERTRARSAEPRNRNEDRPQIARVA